MYEILVKVPIGSLSSAIEAFSRLGVRIERLHREPDATPPPAERTELPMGTEIRLQTVRVTPAGGHAVFTAPESVWPSGSLRVNLGDVVVFVAPQPQQAMEPELPGDEGGTVTAIGLGEPGTDPGWITVAGVDIGALAVAADLTDAMAADGSFPVTEQDPDYPHNPPGVGPAKDQRRPTIAELETILARPDGPAVTINPDGSVSVAGQAPSGDNANAVATKLPRYRNGRGRKRLPGLTLGLQLLADGPKTFTELWEVFDKEEFAVTTVGPVMSRLVTTGKAVRLGDGRWALLDHVIQGERRVA